MNINPSQARMKIHLILLFPISGESLPDGHMIWPLVSLWNKVRDLRTRVAIIISSERQTWLTYWLAIVWGGDCVASSWSLSLNRYRLLYADEGLQLPMALLTSTGWHRLSKIGMGKLEMNLGVGTAWYDCRHGDSGNMNEPLKAAPESGCASHICVVCKRRRQGRRLTPQSLVRR